MAFEPQHITAPPERIAHDDVAADATPMAVVMPVTAAGVASP